MSASGELGEMGVDVWIYVFLCEWYGCVICVCGMAVWIFECDMDALIYFFCIEWLLSSNILCGCLVDVDVRMDVIFVRVLVRTRMWI